MNNEEWLKEMNQIRKYIDQAAYELEGLAIAFGETGNSVMDQKLHGISGFLSDLSERLNVATGAKISNDLKEAQAAFFAPLKAAFEVLTEEKDEC